MNNSILLHTFISFFAGGIFITFLTLIAEKSSEKTAGIILMFPSTLMLGFFFLGWTTSSQTVSKIAPSTLIPLGVGISASTIYIYVSIFSF
ncbi:hypothetical protein [Hippea jasoniae]|uniref:hypothetical protein n=1 Tax=Hippea jasoniae TaxID=944479 RepID=UPI0012EC901C|nr:hypothetical protein [Hippea jasoniae]